MERIIAKIDNDFNPDNSDWIPRVAAWAIDCMSQLKVLNTVKKTRILKVNDRIAISPCPITEQGFIVYDSNGCKINKMENKLSSCCSYFTGGRKKEYIKDVGTTDIEIDNNYTPNVLIKYKNSKTFEDRHNVGEEVKYINNKSYVIIDDNKIELTFDDDYITIENDELETYYSDYFKCELPVILDNGVLIETISVYCMYKMLSRGYKHPVFNLNSNSPATNPYILWRELFSKAKVSVTNSLQGNIDTNMWQAYFYNFTFPKRK